MYWKFAELERVIVLKIDKMIEKGIKRLNKKGLEGIDLTKEDFKYYKKLFEKQIDLYENGEGDKEFDVESYEDLYDVAKGMYIVYDAFKHDVGFCKKSWTFALTIVVDKIDKTKEAIKASYVFTECVYDWIRNAARDGEMSASEIDEVCIKTMHKIGFTKSEVFDVLSSDTYEEASKKLFKYFNK